MAFYETTFIARQDLSKQDVAKLAEGFAAIIEKDGGKILKNEYWGLKSLAYKINKNRKGHYTMLAFESGPEGLNEMERNMRINEDVVRVLTVRMDEIEEGPSVMMQQARSREEYTPDVVPEIVADAATDEARG